MPIACGKTLHDSSEQLFREESSDQAGLEHVLGLSTLGQDRWGFYFLSFVSPIEKLSEHVTKADSNYVRKLMFICIN
jgi:hypothetical protein